MASDLMEPGVAAMSLVGLDPAGSAEDPATLDHCFRDRHFFSGVRTAVVLRARFGTIVSGAAPNCREHRRVTKRIFDILVASFGLVFALPLILATALLVRIFLGSPLFFRQTRPGRNGVAFTMMKFRSMKSAIDGNGDPLPDDQRLTRFGKFIRASSMDELPELWNVLRGDMSLVGPRPLLMEYLPLYDDDQRRRLMVRPGITGWAQVNGRNTLSWEDRFALDTWYVDNQSFLLDLKIIILTFSTVISRHGISQDGNVTMERFTGSSK